VDGNGVIEPPFTVILSAIWGKINVYRRNDPTLGRFRGVKRAVMLKDTLIMSAFQLSTPDKDWTIIWHIQPRYIIFFPYYKSKLAKSCSVVVGYFVW
jgi:hypothetical protein